MLPDQLRLLMSAYISGDLAPRQRAAAERMLRHSRAARRLLRELRRDRRRLRKLAAPPLPSDFADRVARSLPKRSRIIRHSPAPLSRAAAVTPLSRWAAAAVVLVA